MTYFSVSFFVQEVFKLIYSLSASGCLIIEDAKRLSLGGFLVMSLSLPTIPAKWATEQNSSA